MSLFRSIFTKQFFLTIILLGMLVLLSFPLTRNWRQRRAIDKEIKGLETQVNDLEHKNSNLKTVIDYMQSDQFVEEEARTKLNYKKPGESVAVVENRPGEIVVPSASGIFDLPPEPPAQATPTSVAHANKWLDYFFKK